MWYGGTWVNGPDFSTTGACNSSLSQTISVFNPNPLTGYMQNSTCSLSLDNTGTCDLNIRPQFIISNNNSSISQGDIITNGIIQHLHFGQIFLTM